MGRNVDGGRTSLFFSWGCTLVNTPYTAGAVGSPERFASVLGMPINATAMNFCRAVTTAAGSAHPVMAGVTSYWGCPTHGGLSTVPSDYTVLATDSPGGTPVIVARDSPVPCVP
jgi:hypothetical protein